MPSQRLEFFVLWLTFGQLPLSFGKPILIRQEVIDDWLRARRLQRGGILGNNGGLTPEEFQEHIDYLDEFEANLGHAGLFAHNEVYCKKCRWFYTSYRDYILHRRNGGAIESFDEYLEKNSTDDFAWPPSKESERWNAMPRFQFGPAESPFISL